MISPWWALVPFALAAVCAGLYRRERRHELDEHQAWLDQLSVEELCSIDFDSLYSVPWTTRVKVGVGVALATFTVLATMNAVASL